MLLKINCSVVQPKKPRTFVKRLHNTINNFKFNCKDCKYQMVNNGVDVCKIFKYSFLYNENFKDMNNLNYYADIETCRSDEQLCGYSARYFKPKEN